MSDGSRRSGHSSAEVSGSKPPNVLTLSVLGLSGTDSEKGSVGVGKSVFCNRLVRPHYNDFYTEHADFNCSSVINADHWLYWGEVDLDRSDYAGPSSRIRVIEQTTFLDDETFEPHPSRCPDYAGRALRTELDSRGKLMYICRDQLGQESDFVYHELQGGHAQVDAFAILFDVSQVDGRSLAYHSSLVQQLISGALKSKRPVFLLAAKCDKPCLAAVQEFQRIAQKKDFQKSSYFSWTEISSYENVNVADFLYLLAQTVDRAKTRLRIPSYLESHRLRARRLAATGAEFSELIEQLVPREEFPSQQPQLSWETLLTDFGVNCHPAYTAYVAEYGAGAAFSAFEEHCQRLREWWMERELNERLPALRDVFKRIFGRTYLCQTTWEQLKNDVEKSPHFHTYFQPLGRSRYAGKVDVDDRIPSEVLLKPEAKRLFQEYQRELIDEIALERQAEKFRKLLNDKEAVTPGRSFSDAKVMCQEIMEFEQALPPENARWIYEDFQKEIKQKALFDFNELLLENISLFVDLIVEWRLKQNHEPNRINCLNEREFNIICSALIEDKRYRNMSGLADKRRDLISKMANFFSMPLTCFCLAGERCGDVTAARCVTDVRRGSSSLCYIDAQIFGNYSLCNEFLSGISALLSPDKLYHHNGHVVKMNLSVVGSPKPQSPTRVSTWICLIDSAKTCNQLFGNEYLASGPAPIFVLAANIVNPEIRNGLKVLGAKLADHFRGIFIGLNSESDYYCSTPAFEPSQLESTLNELCLGQMGTNYADLRVRVSFLCDDPLSIQQVITPLLDQCSQSDETGGCFCLDTAPANSRTHSRVAIHPGSYHHWLLSKWQLNAFNGHVLVYCPTRIASWKHAETALQLLLDAASVASTSSSNAANRKCMANSILLIAVDDPSNYFKDKESSELLYQGAKLSEKVGCRFMAISASMPQSAQLNMYYEFFAQLHNNAPFPEVSFTVCSQNPSLFVPKKPPSYFNLSTTSCSALTLLSSADSSACSSTFHAAAAGNSQPGRSFTVASNNSPARSNDNGAVSPTPPLLARSVDSRQQPYQSISTQQNSASPSFSGEDMSNRLRRPLSAIGSLMSGSQSAENGSQSSHEEHADSLSADGISRPLRFSPSKFRRLFQRNAGSESSAEERIAKKQLHRSSTVDGDKPEVFPATATNSFTSYVRVPDPFLETPSPPARRPHKSHSVESITIADVPDKHPQVIETKSANAENIKPEVERPSRIRRFTHRCKEFTKSRRRGHSMTPRISSPPPSTPNSPTDLNYEQECRNGDEIPSFLRACVQHIERVGGLDTEGLYRTSGNQAEANELEQHFRRVGQFRADSELSSAVTALKNYVNAFGDPLIPQRLHDEIVSIFADRDDVYDSRPLETRSLDKLRRLFERELPRVNARTLMFLCAHLCRVADNRARNLMPTSNLALIWSASIFRPELTSVSKSAALLARFHVACYFCIKHHAILFSFP